MDLGFTNIGDEQSIDNIDLNNITPSIKLASSVSSVDSNLLSFFINACISCHSFC